MIYIAHRGLYQGYDEALENHPDQLISALAEGFDVELDARLINDEWWLGHDGPTFKVDEDFLLQDGLWIHCKNLDAFEAMNELSPTPNYFWHQNDDYTLTSHGFIWTYPKQPLSEKRGILNQPEWEKNWVETIQDIKAAGICSKFVKAIRDNSFGKLI